MYEYKTTCLNCLAEHDYIIESHEYQCENCNEVACPACEDTFKTCPTCKHAYCPSCYQNDTCPLCEFDEEEENE